MQSTVATAVVDGQKAGSNVEASGGAGTAIELFRKRVAASGNKVATRHKAGGVWHTQSWSDWYTASREIAGGLRSLGIGTGDRVCLLAGTRMEWMLCDVGIVMAGAVTVPIYQSNTAEQAEYIISDSDAKIVLVEDPVQLEKLLSPAIRGKLTGVLRVVLVSDVAQLEKPDARGRTTVKLEEVLPKGHGDWAWVESLAGLRSEGKKWIGANPGALEKGWAEVTPAHTFTIVYTSGTTGPPKGVVLNHGSIVFECAAIEKALPITEEDEQLLFLPLAHIFAKVLAWKSIAAGAPMAFAEGVPQLVVNMQEIRPTFMGAVPRVYEKVYVKLQASFAAKLEKPLLGNLVRWALDVGKRCSVELQAGRTPMGWLAVEQAIADKLIFSKVKATFGGRLKYFIHNSVGNLRRQGARLAYQRAALLSGLAPARRFDELHRRRAMDDRLLGPADRW